MSEAQANKLFRNYFKQIVKYLKHGNTTYSDELEKLGKKLFGNKFKGVFASDQIPQLKNTEMAIVNLDKSNEPGSHWVAIYKSNNNIWIYDSFGRSTYSILPNLKKSGNGNVKEADNDPEQFGTKSEECGQLSISWLCVADKHGVELAKYI